LKEDIFPKGAAWMNGEISFDNPLSF